MDDAAWTLRVRSIGIERAMVYTRGHQFAVGAPVQFDEQYGEVTALEYVLGAVGADIVTGLQLIARRRRIPIDEIEAVVVGALDNPLVYLGVIGEVGHPGLAHIVVKVYVSTDVAEGQVQQVWSEMLSKSPLVHTFRTAIKLDLQIKVVP